MTNPISEDEFFDMLSRMKDAGHICKFELMKAKPANQYYVIIPMTKEGEDLRIELSAIRHHVEPSVAIVFEWATADEKEEGFRQMVADYKNEGLITDYMVFFSKYTGPEYILQFLAGRMFDDVVADVEFHKPEGVVVTYEEDKRTKIFTDYITEKGDPHSVAYADALEEVFRNHMRPATRYSFLDLAERFETLTTKLATVGIIEDSFLCNSYAAQCRQAEELVQKEETVGASRLILRGMFGETLKTLIEEYRDTIESNLVGGMGDLDK